MPKFRQEIEDIQLVVDLVNNTLIPTKNDKVFIKETNMVYDYDETSSLASNGVTIIEQLSATGRWIAISADVKRNEDVLLSVTRAFSQPLNHFYGEDMASVNANDDKIPIYVQINERSHPFVQQLIDAGLEPKIRLMREPMGHRKPSNGYIDNNYSWTIPTHQNEVTGQKQSSGSQHSGNGAALMNPIDTKFDLPSNLKDHVEIMINPTDWFRKSSSFGNTIMPVRFEEWHNDNKVRLRGRKGGRYHGRKKAIRFKFCL